MSRLLLDSTVLIDALRGRPAARQISGLRRRGVEPWTSAISVEEIWRGLLPPDEAPARRLVGALRLAPLGTTEGIRAGTWRREYARQGVTLHQADCLIAAAAVTIGASLATANVDDLPMAELVVEHWPTSRRVGSAAWSRWRATDAEGDLLDLLGELDLPGESAGPSLPSQLLAEMRTLDRERP